jgi:exodeoxyribonuclease VII large subunit
VIGAMAEGPSTTRAPWGVAALLQATGDALSARFGAVAVRGELSGFTRAASGHCYFTLKDADGAAALLRCAMFRRAASLLDFAAADGQQVELFGRLGVYEARGELQMVVEAMRRVGAGTLFEEFLRRRARLAAEGLFDADRKRPLPAFPRRLVVVTSLAAAALRDVLTALARRSPQVEAVIVPAAVQGAEAPAQLVAALATAARVDGAEAVLLVRGGGSLEDLWAFNDESLVRAVRACPLPVVCGVGHETDVTLADLAADLRAATPTAAAELAAPAQAELATALQGRASATLRAAERLLQRQAQRVDHLALRLGTPARALLAQGQALGGRAERLRRVPRALLREHHQALQQRATRLHQALQTRLQSEPLRLAAAAARLHAQDPARVLKRGYAWVQDAAGQPIVSAAALKPGQAVRATWADGRARVVVGELELGADPLTK